MVIADGAAWVFAGTGLRTGDKLFGTVGEEYDRYNPNDSRARQRAAARPLAGAMSVAVRATRT